MIFRVKSTPEWKIFQLAEFCGISPLQVRDNGLKFKWLSWQTVYFFFVMSVSSVMWGYYIQVFISEAHNQGISQGILVLPWLASQSISIITQIFVLLRRKHIMHHFTRSMQRKKTLQGTMELEKWEKVPFF